MKINVEGPAVALAPSTLPEVPSEGDMENDINSAWAELVNSWQAQYGHEPVTLAQVAALPAAQRWMQSGTRQELGASLSNNASLHPTLRPARLRRRVRYYTKAGRVRKPALWALVAVEQEIRNNPA